MRPDSSSSTCPAVVGLTRPERLADGAATGRPVSRNSARATSSEGTRTAKVSSPALANRLTGQSWCAPQHQRQRAWPERRGKAARRIVRDHVCQRRIGIGIVADQRIETRPFLRGEDAPPPRGHSSHPRRAHRPSRSRRPPARPGAARPRRRATPIASGRNKSVILVADTGARQAWQWPHALLHFLLAVPPAPGTSGVGHHARHCLRQAGLAEVRGSRASGGRGRDAIRCVAASG